MIKTKIIISMVLVTFCMIPSNGIAGWINMQGNELTETSNRKSFNDFGAMLIFTDKQDDIFEKWLKPGKAVEISSINTIEKNKLIGRGRTKLTD